MTKAAVSTTRWIGVAISVITLSTAGYGLHGWHRNKTRDYVNEIVDSRIEYLHIKFDVMMTREQKDLAYRIWKQYKEERGIE